MTTIVQRMSPPVRTWAWGPVALTLAFLPLALSQVLQILSLVLLPLSRPLFRAANTTIAGRVWGYWGWAVESVAGTRVDVVGDPLPHREDAIVYSNHQGMADVVLLMLLARRAGSVPYMKWLVKDVLKFVPGVGWGMFFLDCVFLKRDWSKDEGAIRRTFSRIVENRLPVWLTSFPEGTRITPEKHKEGAKRDMATGRGAFRHLLRPRQKGFTSSVVGLRDHVKAVYSVTIGYHGARPTLVGLIRGDARHVTLDVKRYPIETLPRDEKELGAWLTEDFRRKDGILDAIG